MGTSVVYKRVRSILKSLDFIEVFSNVVIILEVASSNLASATKNQ